MSEDTSKIREMEEDANQEASGFILDEESSNQKVAERLRQAVQRGGGHGAVVARSGVKSGMLTRLLNGQDAKRGALVALADACEVSVQWLATGRGPMVVETGNVPALPHEPIDRGPPDSKIGMETIIRFPEKGGTSLPPVTLTWPALSNNDKGHIALALSYVILVFQGDSPVNAGLLLDALAEFYAALAKRNTPPQLQAVEVDRLIKKYIELSQAAAQTTAASSSAASKSPLRDPKSEPAPDASNDPVSEV